MAKGKYEKWLEKDNLTRLKVWARDGLTDEQIAQNMDVGVSTLYKWKNKWNHAHFQTCGLWNETPCIVRNPKLF